MAILYKKHALLVGRTDPPCLLYYGERDCGALACEDTPISVRAAADRVPKYAVVVISQYVFSEFLCRLCSASDTSPLITIDKTILESWEAYIVEPEIQANEASLNVGDHFYYYYLRLMMIILCTLQEFMKQVKEVQDKALDCHTAIKCAFEEFTTPTQQYITQLGEHLAPPDATEPGEHPTIDACMASKWRTNLLTTTNRLIHLYTTIQTAAEKTDSRYNNLNTMYCQFTSSILPYFHLQSERLEMIYVGARILTYEQSGCMTSMILPSPVLMRERLRLELMTLIPEAFTDGNPQKPSKKVFERYIQREPDSMGAAKAREYIVLDESMKIQARMTALDVTRQELAESENEFCSLLSWAVDHGIASDMSSGMVMQWMSNAWDVFADTLGKRPEVMIRNMVRKRKKKDVQLREQFDKAITKVRGVLQDLVEMMLSLGVNPIVNEIIDDKDILRGMAALSHMQRQPASNDVICSVVKYTHCGQTAIESHVSALGSIADGLVRAPSGPMGRCSTLDLFSYPVSSTGVVGGVDGDYYLPYYKADLTTGWLHMTHG
jgi:hypothetical protein